jgi:hypothetical protein
MISSTSYGRLSKLIVESVTEKSYKFPLFVEIGVFGWTTTSRHEELTVRFTGGLA